MTTIREGRIYPRRRAVRILQHELLAYLTGEKSLDLPRGTQLVSLRGLHPATLAGNEPIEWLINLDHESFAAVDGRVPIVDAHTLTRKPAASTTAHRAMRAAG